MIPFAFSLFLNCKRLAKRYGLMMMIHLYAEYLNGKGRTTVSCFCQVSSRNIFSIQNSDNKFLAQ